MPTTDTQLQARRDLYERAAFYAAMAQRGGPEAYRWQQRYAVTIGSAESVQHRRVGA